MADTRLGGMVMEVSGEGPTVVLIHGLGGDSNTFETIMPMLDGYRVIRFDLPGAGRSPLKPGRPGIAALAAAVRDGMRAVGANRAYLVGHSMGTVVCQYLAADHPEMVCGMTLLGPILEPPPAARQGLKDRAAAARKDGMAGIADAVSTGSVSEACRQANPVVKAFVRESLMRQSPEGYAAHCEALSDAIAVDHTAIACPTLLVAGEKDPVAPVAMAETLKSRIVAAELEIIPGIAHWMTMEAPSRTGELLRKHLEKTAA
ncbi:alpha/beta fold hydrolase [Rhodospirillaceae bacterium KN72]|uniref:Alpha/beta fold hydrolase n=1 Tax=Pacificispira spongiicola TaxID=2729598 RepID=A0A7Y0DY39_9PROT|nr:alpha/beta hydrolase [Pacificispira spongiicola]NMM43695.1 alpha/beta fold hydrolase [Pacificispira spongiicola]